MILKNQLLQKYFLLAIATIVGFIILGFVSHVWVMHLLSTPLTPEEPLPPIFFAKMVDRLNPTDKLAGLKEFNSMHADDRAPRLALYDQNGDLIYPETATVKALPPESFQSLTQDYQFSHLQNGKNEGPGFDGPNGPPLFPGFGPPPGGGPPPRMMSRVSIIKLAGSPSQFITVSMGPLRMPPPPGGMPNPLLAPLFLVISLILGIGMALFLVYNSVSKQVKQADIVISQLQAGNLKARFPIARKDEFGKAMIRFNQMAEEIERLVEHLRSAETARSGLLQQLAHDLRTPIASLKSMLQTLNEPNQQPSKDLQKEFLDLSLKEILYFESLVEDLLFLAQVSEPRYRLGQEKIDVHQLLEDVLDDSEFILAKSSQVKSIQRQLDAKAMHITGDRHLLTRLFRNAIDNAISFSNKGIQISTYDEGGRLHIRIEDDGPGFSAEALASFGHKRLSRKLTADSQRVSNGLGSVIIKSISELHRGSVQAFNKKGKNRESLGGAVEIALPQV